MAKKITVTESIGLRLGGTDINLGSVDVRLSGAQLKQAIKQLQAGNSIEVSTLETSIKLSPADAKDLLKQLEAIVKRKSS